MNYVVQDTIPVSMQLYIQCAYCSMWGSGAFSQTSRGTPVAELRGLCYAQIHLKALTSLLAAYWVPRDLSEL